MATTQTTLDAATYGVHEYELGDLLRREGYRVFLTECPLCASDPSRPRYHFRRQENRPRHFRLEHGENP